MNKKISKIFLCVVFIIILYIYWSYTRPSHYKNLYQKLEQFKGFKHYHITNQLEEVSQSKPVSNTAKLATHTNCHMLFYGTSGSGKTSFLSIVKIRLD